MMHSATEFENMLVLATVEALAGAIPEHVIAVSIQGDAANESLDVFIASKDPFDTAEFDEDLRADIDALLLGVSIEIHHWVGADWLRGWPGLGKRRVYQRRHSS